MELATGQAIMDLEWELAITIVMDLILEWDLDRTLEEASCIMVDTWDT